MKLFDVYPLNDIVIEKAMRSYVWDDKGEKYLDLYGGHAVISIGHTHPHYVKRIEDQLHKVGFYSNSIKIPLQVELAEKLGKVSGKQDYQLFLCLSSLSFALIYRLLLFFVFINHTLQIIIVLFKFLIMLLRCRVV